MRVYVEQRLIAFLFSPKGTVVAGDKTRNFRLFHKTQLRTHCNELHINQDPERWAAWTLRQSAQTFLKQRAGLDVDGDMQINYKLRIYEFQ